MADPDDTSGREDHARLQARDIALYRRRSRLNFYEAACLARGFDPERFNGLCLSLIDREIMRDLIERGGAGAVAEYLTSAREIIMGNVGETITDLMKMTGSSLMQTSMPTPALAEMLEDLGLPLPFAPAQDKPKRAKTGKNLEAALSTRERQTLLIIIAALCKEAGIDPSRPQAAGATIEALTECIGARVDQETIARKLKLIDEALESRTR